MAAAGTAPLSYQWCKYGVLLPQATNPSLTLSNLLRGDSGSYTVVVSNVWGTTTSAVATLTVTDPAITGQPASQQRNAGDNVILRVAVAGSAPLSYQWWKAGVALAQATNATLTLSNLLGSDAGGYSVVVSNQYGSVTSAVATLTVMDPAITSQPVNQYKQQGQSVSFNVVASGTAPLNYQWWRNGVVLTQATNAILPLTNLQTNDVGSYAVVVSSPYGSRTSAVAVLTLNLTTLDSAFDPGADGNVHAFAIQADRKILVAGGFTTLAGQPRNYLGRLNADGTLDTSFSPTPDSLVYALAVQPDGKILVGGNLTSIAGQAHTYLARLNRDGTLDGAFNPNLDNYVHSLAVQPDGKILLGGGFTTVGGQTRNYFARLNADGSLDTGFDPAANNLVYAIAVQTDGKILACGSFGILGGQPRSGIGRLNLDGTLDTTFANVLVNGPVNCLAIQADGKILVGGNFGSLGGQTRSCLGRLSLDGTLDSGFNPGANSDVHSLVVQANGQIILGGYFSTVAGQSRSNLARLNPEGTLDGGFNPGSDNFVIALALQDDGRLLVGGGFGTLGGQSRSCLGRLSMEPATQNLTCDGTTITWLRGGAGPEVWRATFDWSTDGTTWAGGAGVRTLGGWQLGGLSPSSNATIRARGHVTGGRYNGSGWFVESGTGPLGLFIVPLAQTNNFGARATFSAQIVGSAPVFYQWFKDGVPLTNGGRFSGATTNILAITNVHGGDAGGYSVVVTNATDSRTSAVAMLTVVDPIMTSQPVSQQRNAGDSVSFSVSAAGTALNYQWWKDGMTVAQGTNAILTLNNLQGGDAGSYTLIVSNSYGSTTSAVATLTVSDPWISTQLVSQSRNLGQSASFSLLAVGTAPLSYQWWKNGAALAQATTATLDLSNLQSSDIGSYAVAVSNQYGCVTSAVAVLTVNGVTVDTAFNPGANGYVHALAVQADGKVLAAGAFNSLGGQFHSGIGRLNADGTLDSGFSPAADSAVYALAVQADNKILAAGGFATLAGQTRNRIGRLNPDGTLDLGFNPSADSYVHSLAVQADGKILVGGGFTTVGGQTRTYLARLNPDGSLDGGFNPGANNLVYAIMLQPDGKIVVGGSFTALGSQTCNYLARLNADGTVDKGFTPAPSGEIYALVTQTDGKILVTGRFTSVGGQPRNYLARLNSDGSLDSGFNPAPNNLVQSVALQANGQIILGGYFTTVSGQPRNNLARLNADGTLDGGFDPGAGDFVIALAVEDDGKILAGGGFSTLGGETRSCLGRLNNTDPATQSLSYDGSTISWLRGGTSPEVWRTTFDYLSNGLAWVNLGAGSRMAGAWQLGGVSLPSNANIRGRAFATGGRFNGSPWFAETIIGPPFFATMPSSQTNNASTTATFSASANGSMPLSYQWLKNGGPLVDGGNLAGTTTPTLTVSNILGVDASGYSLVVSNALGTTTSTAAILTVVDPIITAQPVGQVRDPGQSVTLSVTAAGTALNYQWWKDGAALDQATNATLVLTKLQGIDAGIYTVVVSNQYGSLTSFVAILTINVPVVDPGFNLGADNSVYSLVVQPDGKILVGGEFSTLGGQPRSRIARLNSDGTLDNGFNPGPNAAVVSLGVQADGKILLGGSFGVFGGQSFTRIARLNVDGTVDSSFNPVANATVFSLLVQPDGKILAGGDFTTLGGQPRNYVGRLNADGSLDTSFNPFPSGGGVRSLMLQTDGKILVGGGFSSIGGQTCSNLARLNADGTLDTTFNPAPNGYVYSLLLQPDNRILVGGSYSRLCGQSCSNLARLNTDGTLDVGFNPRPNSWVGSLAMQANGKILVGGAFTTLCAQTRNHMGRLNADGTLDGGLNPGANDAVYAVVVQPDGKILVGGLFTSLGSQSCGYLGRLNNTEAATQSLHCNGASIAWQRGGASPEVWRTSFDYLSGGTTWTSLGAGERIPGGWQLTGFSLTAANTIRARGYVTSGEYNGSGWFVETLYGPPFVITQPLSRTNNYGTTATFTVPLNGALPLSIQWLKNGVALVNGSNTAGATASTIIVSNVLMGDAGGYSLVVSNQYGSITSMVAVLTVLDPAITSQPVSQPRNPGESATFSVAAVGTAPLAYQWWKDGVALVQATNSSLSLTNLQGTDLGSYTVVVSNAYGCVTSTVAKLTLYAGLDSAFHPGPDGSVYSLAQQTDGKILVGGAFRTLGGQPRKSLARLNNDGTVDLGFSTGAGDLFFPAVYALAVQVDKKILVAGTFTNFGGQLRTNIARLNVDGTVDAGFNPGAFDPGAGVPYAISVASLALQADGKILIGGSFTVVAGQTRTYLARLNPDGTLDTGFNPVLNRSMASLAVQADGKILVGGSFTTIGGQQRNLIARLNADGTLDQGFNPGAGNQRVFGYTPAVSSLVVQPDGKILMGGSFSNILAGQSRSYLARLNPDGTLDSGFNPQMDWLVYSLALQADGKILISGGFLALNGQSHNCIGRVNPDGSLDTGFNIGAGGGAGAYTYVYALAVQADGRILMGGNFTSLGGQAYNYFGRLVNSDPATQNLSHDNSTVTWLRGGTSPEVWRTTFEQSTDGFTWTSLGDGARISGGWQVTGLFLSPSGTIRARGYAAGGRNNGSGWFVESIVGAACLLAQPSSQTKDAGATATFSVLAAGSETLYYQWLKNGVALVDGGNISGAQTSTLVVANLQKSDEGGYSIAVSNAQGSVTSVAAMLAVNDPFITVQPLSQNGQPGQSVTLTVTAAGTTPFSYQWWKDGVALAQAIEPSLTLSNLQSNDAGFYSVVVSNRNGSVTSLLAELSVRRTTLDNEFNPGASNQVAAIAVQADGMILVGGSFANLAGQLRSYLGRLNVDGTLDTNFNPGANYVVSSLAVQMDGKILAGGSFGLLAGQARSGIGRINADGTLDTAFTNLSANNPVNCLALQADGRILVGGVFTLLGGQTNNYLARLNADGTLDSTFNPRANNVVYALAVQADAKILVGGSFTGLAGQSRSYLARLNADGTLDIGFNPGASNTVRSLVLQADGKILVGGSFTNLGGQPRSYLARLNTDGTLDTAFTPVADGAVTSFAVQADNMILVGGSFTILAGQPRSYLARLNVDGTLDSEFDPRADGPVTSFALQADGKLLVGGQFTTLGGQPRNYIGRLDNTEPGTQSLGYDGSTVIWLRGGTSPEVWRTTFDRSTDGLTWTGLGAGTRIPGGWLMAAPSLVPGALLRARGYATGGQYNGSGWFVETLLQPTWAAIVTGDGFFGIVSNRFGFNIRGGGTPTVVVEASSNLRDWTAISTNTLDHATFYFSDPDWTTAPQRFYRVRPWPSP